MARLTPVALVVVIGGLCWHLARPALAQAEGQPLATVDEAFHPYLDGPVTRVMVQRDDQILICGSFQEVDGVLRRGVARLHSDGTVDTAFHPTDIVDLCALQSDSGILAMTSGQAIVRLWPDGTLDTGFAVLNNFYRVGFVTVDPLNRIYVQAIGAPYGASRSHNDRLRRYDPNGTIDSRFDAVFIYPDEWSYSMGPILFLDADRLLVCGQFSAMADGSSVISPVVLDQVGHRLTNVVVNWQVRRGKAVALPDGTAWVRDGDRVLRIRADGSGDTNRCLDLAGSNPNHGYECAISIQPDGKTLIAGSFTNVSTALGSNSIPFVARINADGTVDQDFVPRGGPDQRVSGLGVQSDGGIILGGAFTNFGGLPRRFLVRMVGGETAHPPVVQFPPTDLIVDEGRDAEFKILVSSQSPPHYQWIFQGQPLPGATNHSLRLSHVQLSDQGQYQVQVSNDWGALTTSPATLTVLAPAGPPVILVQPVGRSVKEGQTVEFFVVATNLLSLDYQWQHAGTNLTAQTNAILRLVDVRQPDAGTYRVRVSTGLETVLSDPAQLAVQFAMTLPGSVDLAFHCQLRNGTDRPRIQALARQTDGQLIILGQFTEVNGLARNRIARLRPDGSVDASFHPQVTGGNRQRIGGLGGWTTWTSLNAVLIQPEGKILIRGAFTEVDGLPRMRLARLNRDGSVDLTFDPGPAISGAWDGISELGLVHTLCAQADGRILVGGDFDNPSSSGRYGLVRLNSDGALDTNFFSNYPISAPLWELSVGKVCTIMMLGDHRILVGGGFSSFNQQAISGLVCLDIDGLIEPNFQVNQIESSQALRINTSVGEGFLLGGTFVAHSGNRTLTNGLARFFTNGLLDPAFVSAISVVNLLARQPEGQILVAVTNGIARLNADGSPDPSFNQGTGSDGAVLCALVEPDGRILVGGSFTQFDGLPRPGIARLYGHAPDLKLLAISLAEDGCELTVQAPPGGRYSLETCGALRGSPWTMVTTFNGEGMPQILRDTNAADVTRFYRIKTD